MGCGLNTGLVHEVGGGGVRSPNMISVPKFQVGTNGDLARAAGILNWEPAPISPRLLLSPQNSK
jgi:hypothetical protein